MPMIPVGLELDADVSHSGYGLGVKLCRVKRDQPSSSPTTAEAVKDESIQFLLTEFVSIRELRAFGYSVVEKRIQFIIALQAAETAFIGVLVSQHTNSRTVALIALVL